MVIGVAVAAVAALWVLLLRRYFFFANDDIYQFAIAHDHGLGRELLTLNVFGHFGPVNRTLHWVIQAVSPLDPNLGMAIGTGLVVGCLLAFNWLLTELGVKVGRRAAALAALGLSAAFISSGIWGDAAMHSLPAMGSTLLVLAAHVRGLRLARARWHVAACAILAVGLLTQERVALAAPAVVLLDALVVWREESIPRAVGRLWATRWSIASLFAVALAEMRLVGLVSPVPQVHADLGMAARLVVAAFADYFTRALFAFNTDRPPTSSSVFLTQAVVLAAITAAVVIDRTNLKPVLFFVSVLSLYYGLLVASPLLFEGIGANAGRVDYTAYPLPALLIALASFKVQLPRGWQEFLERRQRQRMVIAGAVAAALLVLLVVEDEGFIRSTYTPAAHAFVSELRKGRADWASADITLLPLSVPLSVAGAWTQPFGREQYFLTLVDSSFHQGAVTGPPAIIDTQGHVMRVSVQVRGVTPGSHGWRTADIVASGGVAFSPDGWACADYGRVSDYVEVHLPQRLSGTSPDFALVEYRSSQDTAFRLTAVDANRSYAINDWPGRLLSGKHRAVIPIDSRSFTSIQLTGVTPGTNLCLRSVTLVRPVREVKAQARCVLLDHFGADDIDVPCDTVTGTFPAPSS